MECLLLLEAASSNSIKHYWIYIYVHWHQFSFRIGLPNRTHIVCKISWLDFLYAKGKAFKCEKWCNKPIGITFNWKNKWRWFRHFRCCAMFWCRNNDAQNGVLDTLQIEWTEETRKKKSFPECPQRRKPISGLCTIDSSPIFSETVFCFIGVPLWFDILDEFGESHWIDSSTDGEKKVGNNWNSNNNQYD